MRAWVALSLVAIGCNRPASPTASAGRELYMQHGCASCHGPNGHGDGPIGRTINTPPRDFRNAAAFKNGTGADAIARTIAAGIAEGQQMPPFAHLTEQERLSLAHYVISVRNQSPPTKDTL